jgi:hypothetical protein
MIDHSPTPEEIAAEARAALGRRPPKSSRERFTGLVRKGGRRERLATVRPGRASRERVHTRFAGRIFGMTLMAPDGCLMAPERTDGCGMSLMAD